MHTMEIRRYEIVPGEMDRFLEWWRDLIPVREQYGFTVVFGFADRAGDEFTWAVSFDGDTDAFKAAVDAYHASQERADALAEVPMGPDGLAVQVRAVHAAFVDVTLAPGEFPSSA